ncbi:unnamed protein product [Agarophyton chilense]|eukprot:gb/GEZJ01002539.1/.p1 GENE.gb/GEZJ01002539.1/~~gb/GEZJ01002539.1/.p1  ORF type:complete len:267 (-),score=29.60 gb/GEZJ01002539.1/:716-1516(-)
MASRPRLPAATRAACFAIALLLAIVPPVNGEPAPAPAHPLLSVQSAVTGAVDTISQQIINRTDATSEGRAALEDARAQAQALQPVPSQAPPPDNQNLTGLTNRSREDIAPQPPVVDCDRECEQLADQLLEAVEGSTCRTLFTTGKCPSPCMQAISAITSNSSWPPCAAMCGGEMVTGAAQRWSALCDLHQETLVEKGKEAVKNFVTDGLRSRIHLSALMRFSLGALILFLGVAYGYRRGAISTHIAYRLQKRRLLGRKNSDSNLPV